MIVVDLLLIAGLGLLLHYAIKIGRLTARLREKGFTIPWLLFFAILALGWGYIAFLLFAHL